MAKLENLVTHCSDTPYSREITPDDIFKWHLGAKYDKKKKMYRFKGNYYSFEKLKTIELVLPSGKKISAHKTNGRGWSSPGYSDMINRAGQLINLKPYDFNDVIEPWEVTNGAVGFNGNSRHIMLAGGWYPDGSRVNKDALPEPEELYTNKQLYTLKRYWEIHIEMVSKLNLIGHNDISDKTCPNFNVGKFIEKLNIA